MTSSGFTRTHTVTVMSKGQNPAELHLKNLYASTAPQDQFVSSGNHHCVCPSCNCLYVSAQLI